MSSHLKIKEVFSSPMCHRYFGDNQKCSTKVHFFKRQIPFFVENRKIYVIF